MERDILQMLVKECFQSSTPLCTTTPVRTTTVTNQLHPYLPLSLQYCPSLRYLTGLPSKVLLLKMLPVDVISVRKCTPS